MEWIIKYLENMFLVRWLHVAQCHGGFTLLNATRFENSIKLYVCGHLLMIAARFEDEIL